MKTRYGLTNICLLIAVVLLPGCATVRFPKPLEKGTTAITASYGLMPTTSVAVGHGFSDRVTGFAGLNIFGLAAGLIQTDLGFVAGLKKPNGWIPGVSISPIANISTDKRMNIVTTLPEADINTYWNYGKSENYCYLGLANYYTMTDYDKTRQHRWVPGLHVGNTLYHKNWGYTVEAKFCSLQALGFNLFFGVTKKF
jgi:hypothetical protein